MNRSAFESTLENNYTGKEILATVSKVMPKSINFKKLCIIDETDEGKQNKAGARQYEFKRGDL